jgi:hypothetical protein
VHPIALAVEAELAHGAIGSALQTDHLIEVGMADLLERQRPRFLSKHLQLGSRDHLGLTLDLGRVAECLKIGRHQIGGAPANGSFERLARLFFRSSTPRTRGADCDAAARVCGTNCEATGSIAISDSRNMGTELGTTPDTPILQGFSTLGCGSPSATPPIDRGNNAEFGLRAERRFFS